MIKLHNETSTDINCSLIKKITKDLIDKDIELLIVYDDKMREINSNHRQKSGTTDVLSFPYTDEITSPYKGSIVISIDRAITYSKKSSTTLYNELNVLYLHGLLHILGYDHESDNGEMRSLERELSKKYSIINNLIERNL